MYTDISRTAMTFQAKMSLEEGAKSIYKFSNNKPTMDKEQSHKYLSTELYPILLDVYDILKKLRTMGATTRTGTICAI